MQRTPPLSVVMPVYNLERYLDLAIESVLGQDFTDFELIIVEDGSTDGTYAIVKQWAARDDRIVVHRVERNEGIAEARWRGAMAARGDFVALHDGDDVSLPGRFTTQLAAFGDPDVALVSTWVELIDEHGRVFDTDRRMASSEVLAYLLHFGNSIGGSTRVMLRRKAMMTAGIGDTELAGDYDLWTRVASLGKIVIIPTVATQYRVHAGGMSVQRGELQRSDARSISRRMLNRLLCRELNDDESEAVTGMWSMLPLVGTAGTADRILGEAFARFQGTNVDRQVIRRETAGRWVGGAARLVRDLRFLEAIGFLLRALRWHAPAALRGAANYFVRPISRLVGERRAS